MMGYVANWTHIKFEEKSSNLMLLYWKRWKNMEEGMKKIIFFKDTSKLWLKVWTVGVK